MVLYANIVERGLKMEENLFDIPNFKKIRLENIVLDYNGTIAKDGILENEVKKLLPLLAQKYRLHVITADTFGSVHKELASFDVEVKVLTSKNHTEEKAEFIQSLGSDTTTAIGNGNNDALMLREAVIGIAIMGAEGCAAQTLRESDIVCNKIEDALELFLHPKRLIATLRR